MKKVKLFSQVTRMVYPSISYNEEKAIVNGATGAIQVRKVTQTWTDKGVKIEIGTHEYDESVLEISAVKTLIEQGLVIVQAEAPKTAKAKKNDKSLADLADVEPETK